MWASRPFYPPHGGVYDTDMPMPMDLRKRKEEDQRPLAPRENLLDLSRKRWLPPPPPERGGGGVLLESTIRRLHQSSQLKKEPPSKEERCRSTDTILGSKSSSSSPDGIKRSNSCPDLTVILPPPPLKPSPIKPKSSFIQRSISSSTNNDPTGAKKRKCFVPVYGDPPIKRHHQPPVEPPYDDYYSHPEVLLRRQLQDPPPPYLLHVYDYYQQLVQRLRENSSSVRCLPPPVSPTSVEDEILVQDVNRKRPCRALTGKHVRQGTGASMSTLLTLRQKIQERQQKAREHHQPRSAFLCGNNKNGKKGKQQLKAKENALKAYC